MKKSQKPIDIIINNASPMSPEPTGQKSKLKKLKGIKSVIFDVYGTLVQSGVGEISIAVNDKKTDREALIRQSITDAGFTLVDQKSQLAELFMDTVRAELDIKRDNGTAFPEVDIIGVWEDFLGQLEAYEMIRGRVTKSNLTLASVYYESRVNPCWGMPGAPELIEGLLDKELSLGIISNAQHFTPLVFQSIFGDTPHDLGFQEVICLYSYQENIAKPSPKLFETAIERLLALDGIKAEETLYIGNDMRNDIWPAHELGFKTGLFAGDKRSLRLREDDEDCANVKPDLVITEFSQVLDCV